MMQTELGSMLSEPGESTQRTRTLAKKPLLPSACASFPASVRIHHSGKHEYVTQGLCCLAARVDAQCMPVPFPNTGCELRQRTSIPRPVKLLSSSASFRSRLWTRFHAPFLSRLSRCVAMSRSSRFLRDLILVVLAYRIAQWYRQPFTTPCRSHWWCPS